MGSASFLCGSGFTLFPVRWWLAGDWVWIHQLNSGEEGLSGEQRIIIVVSSGEANVPRSWRAPPPDLFAEV